MIGKQDLDNRFTYHPPKDEDTKNRHEIMRNSCRDLAEIIDKLVPDGREKSLAMTKLEEAMMWANAAIARDKDNIVEPGANA